MGYLARFDQQRGATLAAFPGQHACPRLGRRQGALGQDGVHKSEFVRIGLADLGRSFNQTLPNGADSQQFGGLAEQRQLILSTGYVGAALGTQARCGWSLCHDVSPRPASQCQPAGTTATALTSSLIRERFSTETTCAPVQLSHGAARPPNTVAG